MSIIVPVHNAAGTLEAAVRSVQAQACPNLELILVDDGAEDGSGALCDRFAESDARIRAVHMEDRGVSAARNLGLSLARGERIAFLDADDVLHPSMLRVLSDLLDETGADYAGCGFERREGTAVPFSAGPADAPGGTLPDSAQGGTEDTGDTDRTVLQGEEIIVRGILDPQRPDTRIWSKLFRREYIGEKRFREGLSIGEDFLFLAELARKDARYVSIPAQLYSYYINPNGAMERPFAPNHMDQIRCWELAESVIGTGFPELLQDEDVLARLAARQLTAAVLTASRIAKLPAAQQSAYTEEFEQCRNRIRSLHTTPGAARYLPRGYAVKIAMLLNAPGLYRKLYR